MLLRLSASPLAATLLLAVVILVPPVATAAHFTRGVETAKVFGIHEITLTGNGTVANPQDTLATVTFTPPSGAANAITVYAFHDGDDTWRARAYIHEAGTWTWSSASATDAGLDAQSGTFSAVVSTLRGKLVKHPDDNKAWATDDGRWFLNVSDTAYYLFNPDSTHWQQFITDNWNLGVTSLRANLAGALRQFEKQQASDGWDRIFADGTRNRLNLAALQTDDARLEWMLNNHPHLYVQLILTPEPNNGWGQDENLWAGLTAAQRVRFLRNVVARYAAWPQLFWLVTNDAFHGTGFPNNNAMVAEIGAYLAANDPWKTKNLRSSGPNRDQPFYFTSAPWVSYIHLETTTALSANQVDNYTGSAMHVFNGEDWYEDERSITNNAYFFRRLFWAWTLAGASANYGGYWRTIVPYNQTSFTGLDDAIHLKSFFTDNNLELAGWLPADTRVTGPIATKRVKAMRKPDDSAFVLYHPNAATDGGSASLATGTASLTLINLPAGPYALRWMRADTGETITANIFTHAGGDKALAAPWAGVDVVAYLKIHDAPVKVIFDTDYSTDCDDPGALAVLHALADNGEVEILATVSSTSWPKAPGAIDVVNTYYGRPAIPLGIAHTGPAHSSAYLNYLYDNFPHDSPLADQVPAAVDTYRRILAAQPDDSVVITTVGYLTNIAALLQSAPDAHSPLNGHDLVSLKVKEWACMGGNFFTTSTNNVNFTRDQAAAYYAIQNFPKKLTFLPREVASEPSPLRAGQELMGTPVTNPVRIAYQRYFGGGSPIDRHVADPATVLYAVRGAHDYWDVESTGSMNINPNGTFTWDPAGMKNHHYLVMKGGYGVYSNQDYVEEVIRALMAQPPGEPPGEPPPPTSVDGTIAWYRFEESGGAAITNHGEADTTLNLTDTGGASGRDATGTGGYGAPGQDGFGSAFDLLASGDGAYHATSGGSATGGGLTTASPVLQSALQGIDGAFTYEAFIRIGGITAEQTILSHDGSGTRGFLFRVVGGQLSFYNGSGSVTATIPITGAHAFVANQWFHVAIVYTGSEGSTGNTRFYWTALAASPAAANLIGTTTLAADLPGGVNNLLGVGTTTRSPFRFELAGLIDQVVISGYAREANEFTLLAPPPVVVDADGDGLPDAWEIAHGLDPATDNHLGDADGDGIPNLLEFVLDLDPNAVDLVGLPLVEPEGGFLTLTATRNPDATAVNLQIEVSSDLALWSSGPEHVTILEDMPTALKARDNTSITESARRFMRLKAMPTM